MSGTITIVLFITFEKLFKFKSPKLIMSIVTLDSDLTAIESAKKEMQKLRNVMKDKVNKRLDACREDIDEDGNIMFIEPPDMKWYLKEYRETLKVEGQLEAEIKRDDMKATVDLISIMQQQMKMSKEEKEKLRVIEIESD